MNIARLTKEDARRIYLSAIGVDFDELVIRQAQGVTFVNLYKGFEVVDNFFIYEGSIYKKVS